jgi:hypothetical protein
MPIVNMLEAKTHLSRLVEEVESGAASEIIIARNGKPAAQVGKRLGLLEGQYPSHSQAEFDTDNETIARLFRGDV